MPTMVLVAHGNRRDGGFSNPNVKTMAKSGEPVTFEDAKKYLESKGGTEYSSSSLGDFTGLTDADWRYLFGGAPGGGAGFVNTGKRKGGDTAGDQIWALRGQAVLSVTEIW